MKYIAREQIINLFNNPRHVMLNGLWFSGYEGEGEYKEWWSNGKIFKQSFFKNDKRNGEYKMWDDNGKLGIYCLYKDGDLIKDYLE